jgi:formate hydrogenlyase transcriptional activator
MPTPDQPTPGPIAVDDRLAFERLLSGISSRFVNLAPGDVDREIGDALRRVCEALDIDFAALWQWSDASQDVVVPTHIHPLQLDRLPEPMRQEDYPWYHRQMLAGRVVVAPSLDSLPAEAVVDRENMVRLGIKSNLTVPLSAGGGLPLGLLGFNTLQAPHAWPDDLVQRLQLVSEIFTNALARKRADEALRTSEARYTAAADLDGLGYYEVDFERGRAFVDDRFRDLSGLPADRQDGLGPLEFWMERLHPDDRARVLDNRREMHEGRLRTFSIEYRFLHPSQGEKWFVHMARVAKRDAGGRTLKSYGMFRDITESKRAEEALRKSFEEIERLKDRLQAESEFLKAEIRVALAQGEITGESAAIQKVLREAAQVAPTDSSVLICGETGTGKELVAQAIHRQSPRAGHVMMKVNCAALPTGLVESELFGREKGAYTGALSRQVGRFEVADGSTIFLDEIGELPLDVQAKLLRVLQDGEFERLGSPRTVKVNVRVIAATNRDLAEEVRKGRFRQDLFYRLNVFPIRVPPLRERAEDVPPLVWAFIEDFSSRMGKKITQVTRQAMEALQRYPWPGNVRELRNVIEHAAIITTGNTLKVPMLGETTPGTDSPGLLADVERGHILRTLEQTSWRIKGPTGAAVKLGLKPSTLRSRMAKLAIPYRSHTKPESA